MKIQTRQSIYTSVTFGVVFIIISLLIYALYAENTKKSTYNNLEKTAYLIAFFHLEEDELNKSEFEKIKKQFEEIVPETSYQIYDEENNIVFGNKEKETQQSIIQTIRNKKNYKFSTDSSYSYGLFYEDNQGDFIIITKEDKAIHYEQLITLLWILIIALIIGLITVILLSRWLSRIAYQPISNIIDEVNNFSLSKSGEQIKLPDTKDELQELTETFNHLLERISESFVMQRNFVNYVSHEFKTPLTAMLGNLEVFSLKDRSPLEYNELSSRLVLQIRQLEEIINTLISISELRKETNVNHCVRIDELVWEIINKISLTYHDCKINVTMDVSSEDEAMLTVKKERTQLLMALYNIAENAVKYSKGKTVEIRIYNNSQHLYLSIQDQGIGIPIEQLNNISKPFYRADNTNLIQGSGIGLSIALRILENNNIKYEIESKVNVGTTTTICFEP